MRYRQWIGIVVLSVVVATTPACAGLVYVRGPEAAALGYVNPGNDRRLGGDIGATLGQLQQARSFRDPRPPVRVIERFPKAVIATDTAPTGQQHVTIAIRRSNGRWDTYRYGYRFDPNWGDANTVGVDPRPDLPPGGYIYDIVIKLNQATNFIDPQ